jgi:8-oxo-dGTP pyrophosphatase MutT (NUDIX family)
MSSNNPPSPWRGLSSAQAHDTTRRLPFTIAGVRVGSVLREHVELIGDLLAPREGWRLSAQAGVALDLPREARDEALAALNQTLHAAGHIRGWRHEPYAVFDRPGAEPLAIIERAASRFWGTTTLGAHATGYVADEHGHPTHLWIARRSLSKAVDPGQLDNLVGGGVPWPQSPYETLVREGWEEAGLPPARMRQAVAGRVMHLCRDIAEGLQVEWLHSHELRLPAGEVPVNQDGEVAEFMCLPVAEALERAASAEMTTDAALVTLDFALRHALIEPDEAAALTRRLDAISLPR